MGNDPDVKMQWEWRPREDRPTKIEPGLRVEELVTFDAKLSDVRSGCDNLGCTWGAGAVRLWNVKMPTKAATSTIWLCSDCLWKTMALYWKTH